MTLRESEPRAAIYGQALMSRRRGVAANEVVEQSRRAVVRAGFIVTEICRKSCDSRLCDQYPA